VTSVLALDIGTSSVRAAVYDESVSEVPIAGARAGYAVQPDGTFDADALLAAVRETKQRFRHDVDAVACSCFWHSLVALDARDRPLTPVLTWRDVRSAPQAAALRAKLDHDALWARIGAPLHASFWPPKLAWLGAERPEVFASARRFVSFADWLLLEETGELRTSLSMASATGLWAGDGWDVELLDALGVEAERLPPVSDERVESWFPPLGDGACSNLGTGCTTPERAALMIGTSGAFRVLTPELGPPPPGLFRYRLDRGRAVVGGSLSAGGNLHAWLDRTLRLRGAPPVADRPAAGHGSRLSRPSEASAARAGTLPRAARSTA
jgi:gluconokinase